MGDVTPGRVYQERGPGMEPGKTSTFKVEEREMEEKE